MLDFSNVACQTFALAKSRKVNMACCPELSDPIPAAIPDIDAEGGGPSWALPQKENEQPTMVPPAEQTWTFLPVSNVAFDS